MNSPLFYYTIIAFYFNKELSAQTYQFRKTAGCIASQNRARMLRSQRSGMFRSNSQATRQGSFADLPTAYTRAGLFDVVLVGCERVKSL